MAEWQTIYTQELKVADAAQIGPNNFQVSNGLGAAGQVLATDGGGTLSWASNGNGNVSGPPASVDGHVATFSGVTGKVLLDSGISSASLVSSPASSDLNMNGFSIVAAASASIQASATLGTLVPATQWQTPATRATSAGQVLTDSAASGYPIWALPPRSAALSFGGTCVVLVQGWLMCGGLGTSAVQVANSNLTTAVVPYACTLTALSYCTSAGDASSTFNIRKNNVSQGNFTLPSPSSGRKDMAITFAAGDTIGVYWAATGTAAGQIQFHLHIREVI